MQMPNQNHNNNKNRKRLRKSQLLFIGSFLVFIGIITISYNHLVFLKDQVFANMKIAMLDLGNVAQDKIQDEIDIPEVENVSDGTVYQQNDKEIDYSRYVGVLEIPKISLKRGFYNTDSKYNNIEQNVSMITGSSMPDVLNGNLMLMAHSGDAYISFFAYLYRLKIGDTAYITYQGKRYKYQIVNIYTVPKTGKVAVYRDYNKTTLTLITCTKNDDTTQTVYIAELVS